MGIFWARTVSVYVVQGLSIYYQGASFLVRLGLQGTAIPHMSYSLIFSRAVYRLQYEGRKRGIFRV